MEQLNIYDSIDGAKFLRARAFEKNLSLNVTKVQKLLFIIYGFYQATRNHRIFNETPRAWPYGPVFPRTRKNEVFDTVFKSNDFPRLLSDKTFVKIIDATLDSFGHLTATQLSEWSHSPDSPWEKTTRASNFKWDDEIPDEYIVLFFKGFIKMEVAQKMYE
jgi:uncharacterized phage-associated protein